MIRKNIKISIFLSTLVGVLGLLFFIFYKYYPHEEAIIKPPEKGLSEIITVSINGKVITDQENNFIYSSTLQPKFDVFISEGLDIENLSLKIDDSVDILREEFYGEINQKREKDGLRIVFNPSFVVKPQKHFIVATYQDSKEGVSSIRFDFLLIFNEKFDKPLEQSKTWIIPKDRSPEWFQIQDGKLLGQPTTRDAHSSLAFLYPFSDDIKMDFEITPKGNNVSLVFYFLEFGSFTFGSNDNKSIVLFRKGKPNLWGESFEMLPEHRYHIRITREDFKYRVAIKELINNEELDPNIHFSESKVLLQVDDSSSRESKLIDNHVGFSIWQNSEGVLIDNIFLTSF